MRLIDILTNLKNWSFDINGPYRLQQAEAQTIRDSFADLLFLEFLKKEIPAEQMDELLHRYNGLEEKVDSNDESEDAIRRQAARKIILDEFEGWPTDEEVAQLKRLTKQIDELPSVTPKQKMGHCKDCKWWKDSDGLYRRGGHAESQCPINRREVFEGNGYCYMFEPQVQEVDE